MTIISLKEINKSRSKICLGNGTDFVLYKSEIKRYHISEGGELSQQTYEEIIEEVLKPRCRSRALHLLEKQDRTESSVRQKLKEGGYPSFLIDDAIDYLYSYHYLDDERYAKNYVRFHQDNKSKRRIANDLIAKGVSKAVIETAIEVDYQSDEASQIEKLLNKKKYDRENATEKDRAKMFRFLAYRGFSSEDIMKYI